VGRRTSLEAVAASSDPVIVSHAGACGVHQSKRNITDALITAVAESGGVIGACAFPNFVGPGSPDLGAFLDHIEYLVQLAGIEHVGIGLDFAQETEADYDYYGYDEDTWSRPPWVYPSGIGSFAEVRNIGTGLAERGYGLPEIEAIASGNFLRVFGEVWKAAAPGQHGASEPGEAGQ
jgi:membrane dipeptidase